MIFIEQFSRYFMRFNFQRKYGVVHDLLSVFAVKRLYFQSAPGSLLLITKIKETNKKTPLQFSGFPILQDNLFCC